MEPQFAQKLIQSVGSLRPALGSLFDTLALSWHPKSKRVELKRDVMSLLFAENSVNFKGLEP
jgi:hypothetical protein